MLFAVMLKGSWPGSFSRSVRDDKGAVIERLTFNPREPLVLDAAQMKAVKADVGVALVYAATDGDGNPIPKAATDQAKAAKGFTVKAKPKADAEPEAEGKGGKKQE